MKKILVIGSLNIDFAIQTSKLPLPGETITGQNINFIPGGKGANQAYTLGSLGSDVIMLGAVGDDSYGKMLVNNLKKVNVNTNFIKQIDNESTGNAIVMVDKNGENSIIVISGANKEVNIEYINDNINLIEEADFIVLQLEIPLETVEYILSIAKKNDKKIILDPAPVNKNLRLSLLNGVELIKPNETELKLLTNIDFKTENELINAGKSLLNYGVKNVLVSRGTNGSILINSNTIQKFSSFKVETVDTTAAGDSFTGALVKALSEELPLLEAIKFATLVSAIVVTRKGAQSSIPTMKEVKDFIIMQSSKKEKIIIDADPGVDDLFTILLACNTSKFDIQGITLVEGNCSLENAINNTFKALDLANKKDIKVYKGEKSDVTIDAEHVHGSNGFGNINYDKIDKDIEEQSAVDFIINTVKENKNEITLIAIGPLTNIANAIKKDSEFIKYVKRILIMGGSTTHGNITPFAEFNFYKDPKAAHLVLNSLFKEIIMFGLNVTEQLPLNKNREERLLLYNNDLAHLLFEVTRIASKRDAKLGGAIINDPVTVAYLIDSNIVTLKPANINIQLEGENQGQSNITFTDKGNVLVATEIDSNQFYEILFNGIFN